MTKAEYLISIGYEHSDYVEFYFEKTYKEFDGRFMSMCIDLDRNKYFVVIPSGIAIENQREIDDIQIVFNNVRRDFEEMQKYEEE